MTEQEAINRIAENELKAFGYLYDMYVERVFRFVYYRVGHKQTAEDLTSLIFTKALDKISTFTKGRSFRSWLFSIARNSVIDHYRTSKQSVDLELALDYSDKTDLAGDFEREERLRKVKEYLKSLPTEQRELVIMRVWDELNYEEISQITGKNSASLRVNFSRILGKMQKELAFALLMFLKFDL